MTVRSIALIGLCAATIAGCSTSVHVELTRPYHAPEVYTDGEVTCEVGTRGRAEFTHCLCGRAEIFFRLFRRDGGPVAYVAFINGTDQPSLITSKDIVIAKVDPKSGQQTFIATYSSGEYEREVSNEEELNSTFSRVAVALANQPTPQTSTVNGNYASTTSYSSTRGYGTANTSGTISGTITTPPSAEDYAAAQARTSAQIASINADMDRKVSNRAGDLYTAPTIPPHGRASGIVHFEKTDATSFIVWVPCGERAVQIRAAAQ